MSEKTLIGTYYHSKLPRSARKPFLDQVVAETGVHFTTFYHWMNGHTVPNKACQKVIITLLNNYLPEDSGITTDDVLFGHYQKKD